MSQYEYILSTSEMALLEGLVELLDVFNIFTIYVQGNQYQTMNTMVLFYTKMEDRLKKMQVFNMNETIEKALNIWLNNFPERFKLLDEYIAAALIDPQIQHLDILNRWIHENGIAFF